LFVRVCEKIVLDGTGFVQFRHPFNAGGFYYIFNAVMTHVACFAAAALYSGHFTGTALDNRSYNFTEGNYTSASMATDANVANATATFPANGSSAAKHDAGTALHVNTGKIDNFTLFTTIVTLSAVWTVALVGLLLTMKREYRGSFVSLQTGYAYSRAHFLEHDGEDARRAEIFYTNQRHWRSIRDLVRQWVLGAYATWLQLRPAWLTEALHTHIPDDFMPAPVVQQLDAQAPGGRRRTVESMGTLRRFSLALAGAEDTASPEGPR
jgi:hypothetical protein